MGREMQRLKTWEAHCHLGQSPPHQKSLFFVAWNHCIISGKTEKDREPQVCPALAFGGEMREIEVRHFPHVMWSSSLLYPHCSLASHSFQSFKIQ